MNKNFRKTSIATLMSMALLTVFSSQSIAAVGDPVHSGLEEEYGALAIGIGSHAKGFNAVAIGASSKAGYVSGEGDSEVFDMASGSVALGNASTVYAKSQDGVAIGNHATVQAGSGIAIGAMSEAVREAGVKNAYLAPGDSTDLAWVSTRGAVSVGSDTVSRQITGVAAGSENTDAVNVAQLKALKSYSDATFSTASTTVFGMDASIQIPEDATDPDNVVAARDAVNASVFGDNAKVQMDNSVAIGANSVASNAGRNAAVQFKPDDAAGGAWQSEGLVSFGYTETTGEGEEKTYVTHNRTLTGVAAGSEDNDAVNVAQLKQLEANTKSELSSLMTGETQVSKIQLTTDPTDENAPTIGLRYEVAKAEPAALADGDPVTPTTSQGRLVYDSLDAQGTVIGTETIATLNDGFFVKGGNTAADAAGVKVDLNKGISFLGDEYLQTTVTAGENGGAVVTISTSDKLKDFLNQSGVQPSDPTTPDNPGNSGNTGGSGWNPSQAQLAAMNGNFSDGITVAAGEGNQAIQIKQGNVDMGGNRIQNVGNPINDGDAANKAYVDSTSRSLRNKINDVDKDLRAGVAMAMAVGGLPQAYMPGKSIFGVSAGTYHGQGGFALGLSHATDNRQWVFKGAASVDTRGNFGGQLSAGYQF
ncbi:YadA family autotransporter adhesin [Parasutterella excrementihominis]|uniref:YadA family autotransporter adhesin n=1 Tax=Parasutterella excrementihominis TaxID=487175 RepID=UPI003A906A70